MSNIKRLFSAEVPLWTAIITLFAAISVSSALFAQGYRETIDTLVLKDRTAFTGTDLVYGPQPTLSNANFFNRVKDSLVEQKASFIEADLSEMILRVYKDGAVVKQVTIAAKGREGSWWETPAGLYKIEMLAENHFSSFGRVYQPWSMAFQGNFFIHGWPYYPGGEPVASSFSGGCIRLSNEDAEAVFRLAERDMPVLVFEKDFGKDDFSYERNVPALGAASVLAADLRNNFVFLEKRKAEKVDIGRVSQLVTALIAAEYINLDKEVAYAPGKSATAVNLLYPLMLESDDDMAAALAHVLGESWFVRLMNNKTEALGMEHTEFVDPAGAEEGNVSTAEDIFSLAKYVHNNRSFVWKISTGNLTSSAYGTPTFTNLENMNEVDGIPWKLLGGKFDDEEGSESFIGIYDVTIRGESRPIAIIVLSSPTAKADAKAIADHIARNYR